MWHKEVSRFIKSMFIDFDSNHQIFYHNYFFNGYNIVMKIPLASLKEEKYDESFPKIEKFDITKYVYLLHYE